MDDFFNKSEYNQADIEQLLNDEIEESLKLDYKESGSLTKTDKVKKDISKDVSAFANSDGGLIIYGIEEQNHKPTGLSFINGNEITKEWLEQVIQSNIFRKIEDLHITPIRYDNDITKSIYIVKIPNDSAVPHMANDNRFYRRYNFNSVPMEEYEVRNLYFKQEKTNLILAPPEVTISPGGTAGGKILDLNLTMMFHIDNQGNTIEKLYKLEVSIPRLVYIFGCTHYNPLREIFLRDENDYSIFSFPNQSPLFQNERATFNVANLKIKSNSLLAAQNQPVRLKMYYTGGIEELELDLNPYLPHQNRPLTIDDFKL